MFKTLLLVALSTTAPPSASTEAYALRALDQFKTSYRYAKCSQMNFDSAKNETFMLDIRRDGSLARTASISGTGWGKCIARELSRTRLRRIEIETSLIWNAKPHSGKYLADATGGVGNPYLLTWEVPRQ